MMDVSEFFYEKAKLTLDFVKENPECSIQIEYDIAQALGMKAILLDERIAA